MRGSAWYRARRARRRSASLARAGESVYYAAPERLSKGPSDARVFRHVLATQPETKAWEILALYAAGHADGKRAIAAARRELAAACAGKAAGARPAAASRTAARRRVRASRRLACRTRAK